MHRIWTIERLRNLKPGQKCCYYTGNFSSDIESNEKYHAGSYAAVLRQVQDEARLLERAGKIQLSEKKGIKRNKAERFKVVEYYALGL